MQYKRQSNLRSPCPNVRICWLYPTQSHLLKRERWRRRRQQQQPRMGKRGRGGVRLLLFRRLGPSDHLSGGKSSPLQLARSLGLLYIPPPPPFPSWFVLAMQITSVENRRFRQKGYFLAKPPISPLPVCGQGCQMAKFDPFLSLDCAGVEGGGAIQGKEGIKFGSVA